MDTPSTSGQQVELISFEIADQAFCINIRHVRAIRLLDTRHPIPHAPAAILGMIDLR